ncbi:MAG TPA: M28 family peptidase [Vicinamibacterales bacterium]|nr:M28 family peptidase [Vicinamibacterales bacterium]
MTSRWRFPSFITAAIAVALMAVHTLDHAPVSVIPASQESTFSAERAFAHLETLLAEGEPHPAGSAANRVIADRIEAALRVSGYRPEVQEGFKCSTLAAACSAVRNIIAVRKGRDSSRAIMVTAHYDSVPASPAAADDGAGIATMLEIAQRIAHREPFLHDVVFLFADAEESGTMGAMHFAESHPLMKKVAFVLNLEARGVSGPSLMFETGANNSALIAAFADAAPNPVSNSMLFEVYRRMPHYSDFNVYKSKQLSGLNFAFARGASLYHSERDDLAHLDKASLQHQGDSVWAALARLADTPVVDLVANGDATYFDVGGRILMHWPSAWNPVLAIIGLLLVAVGGVRRARPKLRSSMWSLVAIVALIALLEGASWLLSWPLGHWPGVHPLDHPFPWPARVASIAACVVVTLLVARWIAKRVDVGTALTVIWMLIALVALAISLTLPGVSYLFLAPLLVYGTGAVIESFVNRSESCPPFIAAGAALVVAIYLALYHFVLLDAVFNFDMAHAKAIPLVLLGLPMLPLTIAYVSREDSRIPVVAGVAIVAVASITAMLVPTHTSDRPRGLNLVYVQDHDAKTAQWHLESSSEPDAEMLGAMGFNPVSQPVSQQVMQFAVMPGRAYVKPALDLGLQAPFVQIDEDVERDGKRVVRGRIRSQREAFLLGLAFPAQSPLLSLRVDDQPVLESVTGDAEVIHFYGSGNEPVRFELAARPQQPLTLTAFDLSGIASEREAREMLAKRPDTAASAHGGNRSIVMTRVLL